MLDMENIIPEIIHRLTSLQPFQVILFGSMAQNNPASARDIDLAVILNSDDFPKSYEDRMNNAILVEELLFDLSTRYPLDITVYTKA